MHTMTKSKCKNIIKATNIRMNKLQKRTYKHTKLNKNSTNKKNDSVDAAPKSKVSVTSPLNMTTKKNPWYTHFTKKDSFYNNYMANEWGFEEEWNVESEQDNALFEKLCLESAQSGLSWRTILYKREAYRNTFHNFDIVKVSQMTSVDVDTVMSTETDGNKSKNDVVVKHRAKLESIIHNAKQIVKMSQQKDEETNVYTNFSNYLWSFVNHQPILNHWSCIDEIPAKSKESEEMSKALKSLHGFKFIGPTTCYSFMQSCGFVIDHPINTPEWKSALIRLQNRKGGFQNRKKK